MALLEKIHPFNHNSDNICEHSERVDQYFFANDINNAKKETAIFLTVIGSDTHSLLRNFLGPVSQSTKTVEELFEIVKEHLKPQPITIAERYKFYCRGQNENETISDYIAVLQRLTLNCNFRKFLDEELRDRFVCGLINGSIHRW